MNKVFKCLFVFLALAGVIQNPLLAQTNPLNRPVNLWLDRVKLGHAMTETEKAAQFYFSYKAGLVRPDSIVDVHARQLPVRKVLKGWFQDRLTWKAVNNHVILLPATPAGNSKQKPSVRLGKITDTHTGKPIPDVTILALRDNRAALTDSTGNFSLASAGCDSAVSFYVSRIGYTDTLVRLHCTQEQIPEIALRPLEYPFGSEMAEPKPDRAQISKRGLVRFLIPRPALASSENLRLYESRLLQVSFLPWLSTEPLLTGSVSAHFSLNILAGYNGGVDGIELGGIMNAVRYDMNGLQLAGYMNIVGNRVSGLQAAGFVNLNLGRTEGIQLAGFTNITLDSLKGIQVAGFVNTLKGQMKGVQAAGFFNVTTRDVDGLQMAGFGNFSRMRVNTAQLSGFGNYCKSVGGTQVAGFLNIASDHVEAAQVAGFLNVTGDASGAQVAGFCNIASGRLRGAQIAGFLNIAHHLQGFQLALVNYSDSVSRGVPVGILSIVAHGMHRLELAADPLFPLQIQVKTGVPVFYNQFRFGHSFRNALAIGYGIGSRLAAYRQLAMHFDVSADYLWSGKDGKSLGHLGKGMLSVQYRIFKSLAVYGGLQINALATVPAHESHPDALNPSGGFGDFYSAGRHYRVWAGASIGISFF